MMLPGLSMVAWGLKVYLDEKVNGYLTITMPPPLGLEKRSRRNCLLTQLLTELAPVPPKVDLPVLAELTFPLPSIVNWTTIFPFRFGFESSCF